MSLLVPGLGAVPVVWRPSDLSGPDSDGHVGRANTIRAIVHHRVVGTLESMVNTTFRPTTDDVLQAGERRVSSHFGIGFWTLPDGREELRIYQFVALENTAYCNGQTARDRDACRWQLWINAGRPLANEMTVSIEHEDGGATDGGDGRYVVRDEIIRASIELDRLLLTGDGARIRAAGIHCSDAAAAQLGRIAPSTQTLVDHSTVCPVSKPYCWRPIGDDHGFPQARYVAALTAPATPAPEEETVKSYPVPKAPTIGTVASGTWLYAESSLQPAPDNIQVDPGRDLPYLGQPSSTYRVVEYVDAKGVHTGRAMFVKAPELTNIRPAPDPTPYRKADVDGAYNAALDAAKTAVTAVPRR